MYSIDMREKIIEVYLAGEESLRSLAERFKVSFSFVYEIWTKYKQTGHVKPKKHPGKRPKITGENLKILEKALAENNDILQKELVAKYQAEAGITVTQATMSRTLKRLKITRKKKAFIHPKRDSVEVTLKRAQFKQDIVEIDKTRTIYLDEAGIKLGANRQYAYSPLNTRAYSRNTETSEHITLIAGLTLQGIVAPMTLDGYVDEDAFLCYIQYVLLPILGAGYTVIMDNLSSHQSQAARDLIESKGAKLLFLPPYSPELSPIELAWSKIKSIIRTHSPLSRDSLDHVFSLAIDLISSTDSANYFSHCFKCLSFI